MSRFGSLGTQYFDDSGNPLSAGTIEFYETGTATPKTTYSDEALSIPNADPYMLDSAGRQEDIWFDGQAKAILKNAAGTQIDVIDPVGDAAVDSGISDWSSSATYDQDDVVKGSDGKHYQSVQGSNTNNNPTTPSPSWWMALEWISVWNTNYTYAADQLVSYSGEVWRSLQGSNTGNAPAFDSVYWETLSRDLQTISTPKTGNFNVEAGNLYLINTTSGAFEGTLPDSPSNDDRVGFVDVSGTWSANNFTIGQSGTGEDIMNLAEDLVCDKNYAAVYLEYTGSTYGWVII